MGMKHKFVNEDCFEPVNSCLLPINELLNQRAELDSLCGEILATLMLPANADKVFLLGPSFDGMIKRWYDHYKEHSQPLEKADPAIVATCGNLLEIMESQGGTFAILHAADMAEARAALHAYRTV